MLTTGDAVKPDPTRKTRPIDRRRAERRQASDRRAEVRWEPEKSDRRRRGIGADRRKSGVWTGGE